jgi:hypothetical protein
MVLVLVWEALITISGEGIFDNFINELYIYLLACQSDDLFYYKIF